MHDLIRIEKDKYLNMEIQFKSAKMELEMLEKDKNNQINRLMRHESKEAKHGDAFVVRRLEDEIR